MSSLKITFDVLNLVRIILICAGLVGNVISFVVFSRKTFRKNSINIYCRSLMVFNIIYIVVQLISDFGKFAGVDIYTPSDVLCKLCFYVYVTMPATSGWTLAVFSIDKAASVLQVGRNGKLISMIRNPKFPLFSIATIVLINLLIYVIVPIYLFPVRIETSVTNETNETQTSYICNLNTLSFGYIMNVLFLVKSSLLPFLVMLSATMVITKTLYTSRNKVLSLDKQRQTKDRKFAITSAVFNVLYVIFQLPITFSYLISTPDELTYYLFYVSAVISLNMNFSMPFFVYLVSNSIFRNEFLKLVGLKSTLRTKSDTFYN